MPRMGCCTCPFALTDESEYVQNLGCLPTMADIIRMKERSGNNWACHHDETRMCKGFDAYVKERRPDLDTTTGKLIKYSVWYTEGEEVAMGIRGHEGPDMKEFQYRKGGS